MRAILVVLVKSLRLAWGKFILCALAAVLSSLGISVMVYSYFMSERDFKENFEATAPVDMVLWTKGNHQAILSKVKADESVLAVERREVFTGRIMNKRGSWMPFLLFAAENIGNNLVSKLAIKSTLDGGQGSVFIERNARGFVDTTGVLQVQFPNLSVRSLHYGGAIYDPGLAPATMDQLVYGYVDLGDHLRFLNDSTHRLIVRVKDDQRSVGGIQHAADRIKTSVMEIGGEITNVFIPPPGEHPHQNIVNGISFLQRSFGISLSILGVVLLALVLVTWLYPQTTTIGIAKAIGASSRKLFLSYMVVLFSILLAGTLIGMPLGFKSAVFYNKFIAGLQNFIPINRPFGLLVHLQVFLIIVSIPFLITIVPVLNFTRTTVQQAISRVFYTRYLTIFKVSQEYISSIPFKYSFNNLFRNNQRTLLLVMLLSVGMALLITGMNLKYSLQSEFFGFVRNLNYDVSVSLKDSVRMENVEFLKRESSIEGFALARRDRVNFKSSRKPYFDSGFMTTFSDGYEVSEALVMSGTVQKDCQECIYVGQKLLSEFEEVTIGDSIEIRSADGSVRRYVFSGVIKELVGSPSFYRFSHGSITYFTDIAIRKDRVLDAMTGASMVDSAFSKNKIVVRSVNGAETLITTLDNHLKPTYMIIQVMGYVTIALALVGMVIVLNLSLQERAREIGIMKSIGSSHFSVALAFQREFCLITIVALGIGLLGGHLLNGAICRLFGVMLIELEVPPLIDAGTLAPIILAFITVQILTIQLYTVYKVRTSSSRLLSEVY